VFVVLTIKERLGESKRPYPVLPALVTCTLVGK
jgi:hypothetical protein